MCADTACVPETKWAAACVSAYAHKHSCALINTKWSIILRSLLLLDGKNYDCFRVCCTYAHIVRIHARQNHCWKCENRSNKSGILGKQWMLTNYCSEGTFHVEKMSTGFFHLHMKEINEVIFPYNRSIHRWIHLHAVFTETVASFFCNQWQCLVEMYICTMHGARVAIPQSKFLWMKLMECKRRINSNNNNHNTVIPFIMVI